MPATSSSEVARETIRTLVVRKLEPTPENFRRIFNEVSGVADEASDAAAERTLARIAETFPRSTPALAGIARHLAAATASRNWARYLAGMAKLADALHDPASRPITTSRPVTQVISIHGGPARADEVAAPYQLLARVLAGPVAKLVGHAPTLAEQAQKLGVAARSASTPQQQSELAAGIRDFCYRVELQGGASADLQQGLLRLLRLLVENVGEILPEDQWLKGQIAIVLDLLSKPLDREMLDSTERSLRRVILKQANLTHSLTEAQTAVKSMVSGFIDQLADVSDSTGAYHAKMDGIAGRIETTEDPGQLSNLVEEALTETRTVQTSVRQSHAQLVEAQHQVDAAEARIRALEKELETVSEKVREDALTGMLNRRGLDESFMRAAADADRRGETLAVALLDIDNFKSLNDTFGHRTGDDALVHVASVLRESVRPMDSVARYGGEEFLVLLPGLGLDDAVAAMERVQRTLTRKIFLHDNAKLLITFSAGVTVRQPAETQESAVARADRAMYEAKRSGKNRVIPA